MYELLLKLREQDGSGRQVIVLPAWTCYTVAAAAIKAGLTLRLYDMHPADLTADMDSLRAAVGDDTLAVVSQHLFGLPADVEGIQQIAQQAGCWHIEDAAQAFGSEVSGRTVGTTGDFGLYSFGRGKALAVGGGGALVTAQDIDLPAHPATAGTLRDMAKTVITAIASHPLCYGMMETLPLGLGETHFDTSFEPAALSPYLSRLAVSSLHRLAELQAHRATIAAVYHRHIDVETRLMQDGMKGNVTRYPVLASTLPIPQPLYRAGARRMYPAALIDVEEVNPHIAADQQPVSGSQRIARELITLPTHRRISPQLATEISSRLNDWLATSA